jgi:uncharacterized iron-regulated membrane protein
MQILWALLDIATIIVLGSGLYLWAGRRNPAKAAKPKAALEPERPPGTPSTGHKATGGAA